MSQTGWTSFWAPRSPSSEPLSVSSRTISSTKNGLPAVRSWIRSVRPSSEGSSPTRSCSSWLVSAVPSGSSGIWL